MSQTFDLDSLTDRAAALVNAARRAGSDGADAVVSGSRTTGVSVRDGQVEDGESAENAALTLRVFVGDRSASVSANQGGDVSALAERAVAMAKVSPPDRFAGLAPAERLATEWPDLDLHDASEPSPDAMRETALACEDAALSVDGVAKTSGASFGFGEGATVLVTSHGFSGAYRSSRFSLSVAAIAGDGTAMQRDYDFDSQHHLADLRSAEAIGRLAGERTVAKMNPRQVPSGSVPVILSPRIARGFVGHISGAANASLVARATSYLKDALGTRILPESIRISDDPHVRRGQASRPFDAEGVVGGAYDLVSEGVLKTWVLDSATGRELGLETNGRATRSGSGTSPSSTNLTLHPGARSPEEMIAGLDEGFYVTELIGQGANLVTGRYSRGASGFWIEKGERTFAVSEVTIAGSLPDMLLALEAGSDLETGFSTCAPTLLIEGMTLAGT